MLSWLRQNDGSSNQCLIFTEERRAEWCWRLIKGRVVLPVRHGTLRAFDPPFMHQVLKTVLCLHNFSVRVGMPNQDAVCEPASARTCLTCCA